MLFFNRKEIYIGNFEGYIKYSNLMSENKIKYDYKLFNPGSNKSIIPRATVVGNRASENNTVYYLYVNKKDYENAMFLLRK